MKLLRSAMALIVLTVFVTGCAHPLTMKNINSYKPGFVNSEFTNSTVGLNATTNTPEEERLIMAVANDLKKNGFKVTYPYYSNQTTNGSVDFFIKINTSSQFKGSGMNFFINWPGFLIWAPAIFGYSYTAKLDFDVDIIDNKHNTTLPRLAIPIELKIRHADINRTWTEISWLEFSVIAFIGGLCFISYDHSVTPLVIDSAENKLGSYVGSKIASSLVSVNSSYTNK